MIVVQTGNWTLDWMDPSTACGYHQRANSERGASFVNSPRTGLAKATSLEPTTRRRLLPVLRPPTGSVAQRRRKPCPSSCTSPHRYSSTNFSPWRTPRSQRYVRYLCPQVSEDTATGTRVCWLVCWCVGACVGITRQRWQKRSPSPGTEDLRRANQRVVVIGLSGCVA